jgi:uncharacterized protein (DUF488 family)
VTHARHNFHNRSRNTHQEYFIGLLLRHGITALCDVRSKPNSRMNPQFNREVLEHALAAHAIAYRFLGKELGARSDDQACYEGGRVQYTRLSETELFKCGLKRVIRGLKEDFRIALMCAEKEPLECHRTILVARRLAAFGVNVEHISADGRLESHATALNRLARMHNLPEEDMFRSREDLLAEAYSRQEERIAYDTSQAENIPTRSAAG